MGQKWGQHFLRSEATVNKIVAASGASSTQVVVEIGPGEGVLTQALCPRAARIHAFEIDPKLCEGLLNLGLSNLHLHQGDFLKVDPSLALGPDATLPVLIVANLPYYITAPIVERLCWQRPLVMERAVLMMQEEVAQRICYPATRLAGAITYIAGAFYQAEYLFKVSPGCFSPPPNVDSAVIRLTKRSLEPTDDGLSKVYERLVSTAFQGRRKQLGKSLRSLRGDAQDVLTEANIDFKRRPETLSIEEFWQLARTWSHRE